MDKNKLIDTLLAQQNNRCFICEKPINKQLDIIEIDHIIPRARGGKDDPNNYAVTHDVCNRNKSDSDLRVARCMAKYETIKDAHAPEGPNRPNLEDFLNEYGGGKYQLRASREGNTLVYTLPEKSPDRHQVEIHKDKLSNLEYAFVVLPVEYIFHDSRINPRAVSPRIQGLLSEFLLGRPQLHTALAWGQLIDNTLKVHIFDGQHKVVAQMMLGIHEFPMRLFLNPDLNLLLQANTNAGTSLKQVAFDPATQRFLGSTLYLEKIDAYRKYTHRSETDLAFSEQDLLNYFSGERREVTRYILDDVRMGVIHNSENKLKDYIDLSGQQNTDKPLSFNTIEKTVFSLFIRKTPMTIPMNYKLEIGENPRQLEKEQIVRLLNILADRIYTGNKFDFDIGANKLEDRVRKGETIPESHIRAVRLGREEVLYNILRYVRELIKHYYVLKGKVIDESGLFQYKFPEELWLLIDKMIYNFSTLPIWVNKQLSGTVFGVRRDHEYWKIVFESGNDRAGTQLLAKPLDLNDLVK